MRSTCLSTQVLGPKTGIRDYIVSELIKRMVFIVSLMPVLDQTPKTFFRAWEHVHKSVFRDV